MTEDLLEKDVLSELQSTIENCVVPKAKRKEEKQIEEREEENKQKRNKKKEKKKKTIEIG